MPMVTKNINIVSIPNQQVYFKWILDSAAGCVVAHVWDDIHNKSVNLMIPENLLVFGECVFYEVDEVKSGFFKVTKKYDPYEKGKL